MEQYFGVSTRHGAEVADVSPATGALVVAIDQHRPRRDATERILHVRGHCRPVVGVPAARLERCGTAGGLSQLARVCGGCAGERAVVGEPTAAVEQDERFCDIGEIDDFAPLEVLKLGRDWTEL